MADIPATDRLYQKSTLNSKHEEGSTDVLSNNRM